MPPAGGNLVTIAQLHIDGTPVFVNPGDPAPDGPAVEEGDTRALAVTFNKASTAGYTLLPANQ